VGHVDHGKSTLIGTQLYDSDRIKDERVEEIDTVSVLFKSKLNYYMITDVPKHKEFIKKMLTGASHADVAVFVVSAEEGVQEQTRKYMFLLKMLGIKQVIVAVNKMDAVDYKKERFETVKNQISELLNSFDYQTEEMLFIPVSALEGDNIYRRSEGMIWFDGPTLIEALDGVRISERDKPLRFVVQDVYTVEGEKTNVGRIESGMLRRDDEVIFEPSSVKGEIEEIKVFGGELEEAKAGDSIGVIINEGGGVKRGDVFGLVGNPPKPTKEFFGEAVLLGN